MDCLVCGEDSLIGICLECFLEYSLDSEAVKDFFIPFYTPKVVIMFMRWLVL